MQVVLKVGGNVLRQPGAVATLAAEVRGLLDAGLRVTVVHGGGPQLDAALGALGEPGVKLDGLRVTSARAAATVRDVLDAIGRDLAAALGGHGVACHHVGSASGAFAAEVKRTDLGRVGTVIAFRADLGSGVAVVTPVGFDAGGPLNLNADEGAAAVAAFLGADWLVLGTDVSAVRDASGTRLDRLTAAGARRLIGGAATGGMIPKLENAIFALDAGVKQVLITQIGPGVVTAAVLSGRSEGTLVEATP